MRANGDESPWDDFIQEGLLAEEFDDVGGAGGALGTITSGEGGTALSQGKRFRAALKQALLDHRRTNGH